MQERHSTGTGYTGHASSGGLQRHSIGELYPFTIIGQGRDVVQYRWMHLHTGQEGRLCRTYKEAEIDLYSIRVKALMNS